MQTPASVPDLTMLAMAAYTAIRKNMEDTHEKKTHMERERDQRRDRLSHRLPAGSHAPEQCSDDIVEGCRLITI